ncbi:hypothetical protein D9M68_945200 [compost metagenome]
MVVEPTVLISQQSLQVKRRNLFRAHGVAPHAISIGKAPQGRAVFGQHYPGQVITRQRQRPDTISQPEQAAEHQQTDQRGTQQPARTAPWSR